MTDLPQLVTNSQRIAPTRTESVLKVRFVQYGRHRRLTIDDFARLKVNIRNINNSAAYLSSYAESDGCRKDKLIELMDWEIARNFGYYICFSYMKANNFQFPDPETILVYSMNHSIQKAFEQIYLSIPKDKRHKDVAGYLNMYFNDREFKRNVVILPKSE